MRGEIKFFAGVAIGIGIGAATDNLGVGIGIGIALVLRYLKIKRNKRILSQIQKKKI